MTGNGSGFGGKWEIMWKGSGLPTTFIDSDHLQTPITQQTFASFGGSTGSTVQISVSSPASVAVVGCPNGGKSSPLGLVVKQSVPALATKPRKVIHRPAGNGQHASRAVVTA